MDRDPSTGRLVPDPAKFPKGIKGTADSVHGMGLKIGIYSSAGTQTCQRYPASLDHEELDAQTWADWGIDCKFSSPLNVQVLIVPQTSNTTIATSQLIARMNANGASRTQIIIDRLRHIRMAHAMGKSVADVY